MTMRLDECGGLPMFSAPHDGETYDHDLDGNRLSEQTRRVYDVMRDGQWHSLAGIAAISGAPEASVSARLRDLRKPKFGGYTIQAKRDGTRWLYRMGDA